MTASLRIFWLKLRGEDERWRKIRSVAVLLRPYRGRVALSLLAMVFAIAAGLAPPYLAKIAVDSGILKGSTQTLVWVVVAFLASAAIYALATALQTYLVGWVGQRVLANLRLKLFGHLQQMSVDFYSRNRTGVLVSRLTNDVQALDQLVSDGLVTLLSGTLTLVGATVILFLLDFKLALITFVTFPILAAASLAFRNISARAYRLVRDRVAHISGHLQETLTGIRIVRAHGQEERHKSQFANLNQLYREANMKTVYLNAAYYPSVELLSAIGTMVILLFGGYQAINGQIEIGVLVAFVGYLQSFFDPIQQLSQLNQTYQQGMAALDKIFDLLDQQPDLVDSVDAKPLPRLEGRVEFRDVSFAYQEQRWVLQDINLEIAAGQTVALVGHTGAGKSTLAKLIARFYDPQQGSLLADGHDLRQVTINSLRSQLGIVPQEGFLFSGTVRDNIRFGRPDASDEQVVEAARSIGAHDLIEKLLHGYETEVGERGSGLSAGQRQLIAFTRALIADPRILILDEATSSVDIELEARIEGALKKLLVGRTSVVIAHRLSTVRKADKIVVLEAGRIVESGTHAQLITAHGHYYNLYKSRSH